MAELLYLIYEPYNQLIRESEVPAPIDLGLRLFMTSGYQ